MDQLTKVNNECFKMGITYAEHQKQCYPITTGINKHSKKVENYPEHNYYIENKARKIHVIIHPEQIKTYPKVSLTRSSLMMLNLIK